MSFLKKEDNEPKMSKESMSKVVMCLLSKGMSDMEKIDNKIEELKEVVTEERLEENNNDYYLAMLDYLEQEDESEERSTPRIPPLGFHQAGAKAGRMALKPDNKSELFANPYSSEELEQMTEIILEFVPHTIKNEELSNIDAVKKYLKMLRNKRL